MTINIKVLVVAVVMAFGTPHIDIGGVGLGSSRISVG